MNIKKKMKKRMIRFRIKLRISFEFKTIEI